MEIELLYSNRISVDVESKKLGASTSTRYTIPTYPYHLAASHSLASPAGHSLVGASDITEASCHPLSQHVVCDNIGDIKLNDSDMTLKLCLHNIVSTVKFSSYHRH